MLTNNDLIEELEVLGERIKKSSPELTLFEAMQLGLQLRKMEITESVLGEIADRLDGIEDRLIEIKNLI